MVRLTFLGTADAFNGGARGHSCYWVDDPSGAYAVDFGPTALMQLRRYGRDPNELDAIFLTHLHGDHIGGLAVLLIDYQFKSERTRPLVIAGPLGSEDRVRALMESAYPSIGWGGFNFPLRFETWLVPGVLTLGDREIFVVKALHDQTHCATSFVVRAHGVKLAFSGDSGWNEGLVEVSRGADLFVCECTGVNADYWAHLSVVELLAHRDQLDVKRLYLTHLSTMSRAAATEALTGLRAVIADDGMVIDIEP